MTARIVRRWVMFLRCGHCKHGWYPVDQVVPKVCPKCKYILELPPNV